MRSELRTFSYPDGTVQRVQLVRPQRWEDLDFMEPAFSPESIGCFSHIYRRFLVPGCPWLFGRMILFWLPEDAEPDKGRYGDSLTAAAAILRRGVRLDKGEKPRFLTEDAERLWKALEEKGALTVVSGKLPITTVIPISRRTGYLSRNEETAAMKVNASFFIMDRFDCATVYDQVGTPLGLRVKDGVILDPPLYEREALLVKRDGSVAVEPLSIRALQIRIGDRVFTPGVDADVFTRPARAMAPGGKQLVIVGRRVAEVLPKGHGAIPASGFVLRPHGEFAAKAGDQVTYLGLEDVTFGIQVGNSILRKGRKTEHFISKFYNIRGFQPVPYPPSLYPLDFRNARAARIALGADADGKPMILWAEGAGKIGYVAGKDSRGASLSDMAELCAEMGMVDAVNLDGGGSAQILVDNRRSLMISDRNAPDASEAERPVPMGLIVRQE